MSSSKKTFSIASRKKLSRTNSYLTKRSQVPNSILYLDCHLMRFWQARRESLRACSDTVFIVKCPVALCQRRVASSVRAGCSRRKEDFARRGLSHVTSTLVASMTPAVSLQLQHLAVCDFSLHIAHLISTVAPNTFYAPVTYKLRF